MSPSRKSGHDLRRAFDTIRFGDQNILNLRESLPTPADATARAEAWLRQRQVEGADEVLVISGRGNNSEGGVSPVREAIVRLILSLRRRGVVSRYEEHTAGSFSIELASLRSMVDAPRRRRDPHPNPVVVGTDLSSLGDATRKALRQLAERALDDLGVKQTATFVEAEMSRQLAALGAAAPRGEGRDAYLQAVIKQALDQTP